MNIIKPVLFLSLSLISLQSFAANKDAKIVCSEPSDSIASAVASVNDQVPGNSWTYQEKYNLSTPIIHQETVDGVTKTTACVSYFLAV